MAKNKLFKNNTFEFVGVLSYGEAPITTKKLSDTSKWSRTRLGVAVRNGSNSQFLNMEYIHNDSVKTCKLPEMVDGNVKMFEVNLDKTTDKNVIERVPNFARIVLDLENDFEKKDERIKLFFKKLNHERKETKTEEDLTKIKEYEEQISELSENRVEFAHMKDAIKFLNASLPTIGKQKVRVTGNVEINYYNGKSNLQYVPSLIELVPEESENKLKVYCDFFYDKDGIDDDTKEKKMFINGYIGKTVSKAEKLFPVQIVLDYTKINEEDEKHTMLLKLMKDIFKIIDKKQIHKNAIELNLLNGREQVEFSEECLTDMQKMYIQMGMAKLEDYKPKGNSYGNKIQELRVVKADLKEMPNGSIEVFPIKELEDYLQQDDSDKNVNDVKNEEKKPDEEYKEETKSQSTEDLMASLFG